MRNTLPASEPRFHESAIINVDDVSGHRIELHLSLSPIIVRGAKPEITLILELS